MGDFSQSIISKDSIFKQQPVKQFASYLTSEIKNSFQLE
jgi:hypothetical protein